jgi:hypothetical protein
VQGAPARYTNPAEGDLAVFVGPNAGLSRDSAPLDSVVSQSPDDDLFERAHVPTNVGFVIVQVDYWIKDRLFRAVVGYASAALDTHKRNAARRQLIRRSEDVGFFG